MNTSRLTALQTFLEQDPSDSFTRYAIAMEYASQKDFVSAIEHLKQVILNDTNYIPAYHQLGLLYAQLGKKEESKKYFLLGIQAAKAVGDSHAQGEMQESLDELEEQ